MEEREQNIINELISLAETQEQTAWLLKQFRSIEDETVVKSLRSLVEIAEKREEEANAAYRKLVRESNEMVAPQIYERTLRVIIDSLKPNYDRY